MPTPLLVVGSLALDDIETPFGKEVSIIGGAGYYASIAASLFAPVRLVGIVGEDFPTKALELLKSREIDTAGVEIVEGGKSFHWAGRYEFDMNRRETLDTQLNVFGDFDPILPTEYLDSEFVFLANAAPEIQLSVLDQLTGQPFVAMDTMNYWMDADRETLEEVISRSDVVLMNDSEVRQFSGVANLERATDAILDIGASYVAMKMGVYGACLVSQDGRFNLPCCPVPEVFDPTGAGDAFAGGMMGYLAWADNTSDANLRVALALGTITASRACETFGTEALLDTEPEEIYRRYETLKTITDFSDLPDGFTCNCH